jgi:hypothetical protein
MDTEEDKREEQRWRRRRRREREYEPYDRIRTPTSSADTCSTLAIVFGSIGLAMGVLGWVSCWFTLLVTFPLAILLSLTGLILGCCSSSRQKSVGITLSAVGMGVVLLGWFLMPVLFARQLWGW